MILFPPAKINLGLNVLGKREDGFHEIDTCMVSIPFYDVLEIIDSSEFKFKQSGLPISGDSSENLVVKAYELMQLKYKIDPVYIHLQKHIPMGAGLGGGSADATYTIVGLNEFFNLGLNTIEIQKLSAQLGSDCPFFASDSPQIASGRGEKLRPIALNLENLYLKIVNPNVHVSTKDAFSKVNSSAEGKSVEQVLDQPIESWKTELKNDFESSVFQLHPVLEELKDKLYEDGAVYASMTGSGSTCYGIYKTEPKLTFNNFSERVMKL